MPRSLQVAVLKDGNPFLQGTFDVSDADYGIVVKMLEEVEMDHGQAASLISGYMHARDVGRVSDDMGKIAMFAVVYMLEAGETNIEIPFEA